MLVIKITLDDFNGNEIEITEAVDVGMYSHAKPSTIDDAADRAVRRLKGALYS